MNRWLGWVAAGVLASALAACGGGSGDTGPAGPPGPPGNAVNVPSNSATPTPVTTAAWANLAPQVTVTSVSISSPPVVNFKVTDASGNPVLGLGNTSKSSTATVAGLTNLSFALAKLLPAANGAPARWVSYIVTTVPTTSAAAAPTRPSTDNTGVLVDNKDGTYVYTFYRDITQVKDQVAAMTVASPNNKDDLGDLTYVPGLVHRLTIQLSGDAPGTGANTPTGATSSFASVPMKAPVDAIYDFVPATGAQAPSSGRDIVATANCNGCHRSLGGIPGDSAESSGAGFHGGNRNETRYCVVCHTEQRKYGRTEASYNASNLTFSGSTYRVDDRAVGNFPNYIHKIHNGPILAKQKYDYAGAKPDETHYPQDIRNCTKCHDGSATAAVKTDYGDNWKNLPNRLACGGCHDGINFATGQGVTLKDANANPPLTSTPNAHPAGPQPDDSLCATCHKPSAIDLVHLPITAPNPKNSLVYNGGDKDSNTNSAWLASNSNRLPEGAIKVSYDIKSVSLDGARHPLIVFRMLQNGQAVNLNTFNSSLPVAGQEIWNNFAGSPSAYFVFAVPQDGIAAPADFNASASAYIRNVWNGVVAANVATMTGPDAGGYYTVTLTGSTVPAGATMLTGGIGYSYSLSSTQPLIQTNLAAYPVADALYPVTNVSQPNKSGGLIVIAPNAQKVATNFTGRRAIVEDARCNACHQELGTFTEESFHGGQRNDGTTCAWCHTPNKTSSGWSADSTSFIHSIHAGAKRTVPYNWHASSATENFADVQYPGVLKECETCHLPGTYDFSASASASAVPNRQYRTVAASTVAANVSKSPYVPAGSYGAVFAFNASTGVTTPAAGTTLVISPIATACFACHDSSLATTHMQQNGGSIYASRASGALNTVETCMLCHGPGRTADIKVMHAK
ncbi:OmcA/MtrC family decaheme c-type cytochrome [Niveibacterium sp. SC-1]|uniref:OmcA/MtrC family decaheme c-type cytochrome n=1 Tax=Niveibacterium sp. SC-1 TaxID=3135646 RepID=UPI00311D7997